MHFLLIYELAADYLERRGEFRDEHLGLAWQAHDKGELILGGALQDPVDEAILLFKGETAEVAEKFVRADPYVKNGLIKKWSVRPWTTVVGDLASTPVKPGV
ncbi:MAG TPA: YciI-like protein [Ignavibacteriales bacterium]|nr:YciI-like protein [Ignavibacteriales bacterium]